jgi:hypothetical protein
MRFSFPPMPLLAVMCKEPAPEKPKESAPQDQFRDTVRIRRPISDRPNTQPPRERPPSSS